jgi:hypothetical protein
MRSCFPVFLMVAALAACVPAGQRVVPPEGDALPRTGGTFSGVVTGGALMGPFSSLNDDCSVSSHARIRILEQPSNGSVRVRIASGDAAFPAGSRYAKCNSQKVRGPFVDYTAKPGYAGPERFSFEVIFRNGERRVLSPELIVRPRS